MLLIEPRQDGWTGEICPNGLCDYKFHSKLKGKFNRRNIRPTLLCGSKSLAIKNKRKQNISLAKMRIFWWMFNHRRKDKVEIRLFSNKIKVLPIENKMQETWLKWFGDMRRRPIRYNGGSCSKKGEEHQTKV